MDLSLAEDLFAEVIYWASCDLFLPAVSLFLHTVCASMYCSHNCLP